MTIELLIQAIVRQTAVLVAQLATSGGVRAPLAQIANQVFIDIARELERIGVSRKVSADMFGLDLRTYRRKMRRVSQLGTDRGRSLREDVLEYLRSESIVTRGEILARFPDDDEAYVGAVLRDLRESQLVFTLGKPPHLSYRAASADELAALKRKLGDEGTDELHLALMYREGALSVQQIADRAQTEAVTVEAAISRLSSSGVVQEVDEGGEAKYRADALVIPLGSKQGWEAAVFDHFKAVIGTVTSRLRSSQEGLDNADRVGGSTYTLAVWEGHPMAEEIYGTLARMRRDLTELRVRADAVNEAENPAVTSDRVVVYVGQYLVSENETHEV